MWLMAFVLIATGDNIRSEPDPHLPVAIACLGEEPSWRLATINT